MVKEYTEPQFATQVEDLLKRFGWRWCHFRPARTIHGWRTALTGHEGFPDYVAVRPPRLIIAELKSNKGKVLPAQQEWLDDLKACRIAVADNIEVPTGQKIFGVPVVQAAIVNPEVYLWRPDDIEEIAEVLR